MSEKVVLPKFDLPSERTHPAVKATAIVGALLLISMLILGGAIWQRRAAQVAAEHQRDALIAERVAEANAAAAAAKARIVEAAAKEAAAKAKLAADQAAAKAKAEQAKTVVASAESSGHHHGHHHHRASAKGRGATVAAKGASGGKKSPVKSTRDNATIDKLLASFK